MVEFNLLPDVKMEYLRTKGLEHLVVTVSFIVGAASIAIFILMLVFVDVVQKVKLDNLTSQINSSSAQLVSNTNLNQVLTVQKQLETIPQLENESPTASRVFNFISQLTPASATISSLDVNFSSNVISITGAADSLATVNTYVDTLKYATYDNTTNGSKGSQAFSAVVLSSFDYSSTNTSNDPAQYTINFDFSPTLFNSADNISLVVPSEITTRSILNQPTLFKATPAPSKAS